jgi:hypothetical protein
MKTAKMLVDGVSSQITIWDDGRMTIYRWWDRWDVRPDGTGIYSRLNDHGFPTSELDEVERAEAQRVRALVA